MHHLIADWALTPGGFVPEARIAIEAGTIVAVDQGGTGERVRGLLLPGMTDLHSHAFQRSFAGHAQVAEGDDDFWTWRRAMYERAARITPETMRPIAAYLGMALLRGGCTAIAEFHYLQGSAGRKAEMAETLIEGFAAAGIALTLLFGVYETSGFGAAGLSPAQAPLGNSVADALSQLRAASARAAPELGFGLAPHSLRAVPPASLAALAAAAPDCPIHIHVAEQVAEVRDCVADRGAPPVAWLLDHAPVDRRWCLIHATHAAPAEIARAAGTGAVIGLCPTTEADLGDGVFDFAALMREGGAFGVGSDSNVCTDAFAELRQLEYAQRLTRRRRNLGTGRVAHTGQGLWAAAAAGGAAAAGRPAGAIAVGRRADLVAIAPSPECEAACDPGLWLDAAMFAASGPPARDVMVGGVWRVRDGAHARQAEILGDYRRAIARLA